MKVRHLKSPKVFPEAMFVPTNSLGPKKSQASINGQIVTSVLCTLWSSVNKFVAAIDVPESHSGFERVYQDWILPQIQIKSVSFILLSILCLSSGLTVFSQEDYQYFDGIIKWSFKLSLAIMPYVFSSAVFILVLMYFLPQLMEKKQHYVTTSLCIIAMVFVPAGNVLLNIGEHGTARMDTLLLNAHLPLLTLLYYNQSFFKVIFMSAITFIVMNLVNIFVTFNLLYVTQHAIRLVSFEFMTLQLLFYHLLVIVREMQCTIYKQFLFLNPNMHLSMHN